MGSLGFSYFQPTLTVAARGILQCTAHVHVARQSAACEVTAFHSSLC